MKYAVTEIFDTLIGEGFWTGTPATFVRLAGCNLDCSFCDTDFRPREWLNHDEIASRVGLSICVLTGGEPLIQDVTALVAALHSKGARVHIETNGTKALPCAIDWVCVSPKALPTMLQVADECKVVLGSVSPDVARATIAANHYWIQPMSQDFAPAVEYVIKTPGWRLSLQTHKLAGFA